MAVPFLMALATSLWAVLSAYFSYEASILWCSGIVALNDGRFWAASSHLWSARISHCAEHQSHDSASEQTDVPHRKPKRCQQSQSFHPGKMVHSQTWLGSISPDFSAVLLWPPLVRLYFAFEVSCRKREQFSCQWNQPVEEMKVV